MKDHSLTNHSSTCVSVFLNDASQLRKLFTVTLNTNGLFRPYRKGRDEQTFLFVVH